MAYLKNCWYAAAFASELTDTSLLAKKFLGQPVVLFRDSEQQPVALQDRCPHRFAPLSRGQFVEQSIQCPYHGLRFDHNGRCVHNPHGPIPPSARVARYPLLDRFGITWIWMGQPEAADAALLPDFGVLAQGTQTVRGSMVVGADYELITDNLLDLSHAAYLHPMLGNPDSSTRSRFRANVEGNTVWSLTDIPNEPVTKLFRLLWSSDSPIGDRRIYMRWDAPSNLLLEVGFTECGRPPAEGATLWSGHLLSPVDENSTQYLWVAQRNTFRDKPELDAMIQKGISTAFMEEDRPIIEACQQRMGTADLMSLSPLLLKSDAAAVQARRVLQRLMAGETTPA